MPLDPTETVESLGALRDGLAALAAHDVAGAFARRNSLPSGSIDRHILDWAIALDGGSAISSDELGRATQELAGWPGTTQIRRSLERAVLREQLSPQDTLQRLGMSQTVSTSGSIALARAYFATGKTDAARAVIAPLWRNGVLSETDETGILTEFGSLLTQPDHRFRMERLLYEEQPDAAARVATLAGAEKLDAAWTAVLRRSKDAGKLLSAVPKADRSPGFAYAQARYLRLQGKREAAAGAMKDVTTDADKLVDPDRWWDERRILARQLLDAGKPALAYQVVAGHGGESIVDQVDAEFHAGWIALRFLRDPAKAAPHFQLIADTAKTPVARSRAYYWLGRAAAAQGKKQTADDWYAKASAYGTTFYGQVAAAELGRNTIDVAMPAISDADKQSFAGREAVRALARLNQVGANALGNSLYINIAQQLTSPGELSLLAQMAEDRGNHYLALKVGKIAAQRGIDVGGLSHPVGAIPDAADISAAGKALAYAIARQESEFNIGAVSKVGALGLLQLMPGTAQQMAKSAGLAYAPERLTTDAGYNATLGSAFLGQQLDQFGGSYILTFIGYNAGPKRAQQWVAKYGDPRGKDMDSVVDWIERIPFSETRGYVQRVMENYQVYKMRLTGRADIDKDLRFGRS